MKDHPYKCLHCGTAPLTWGDDGYHCPTCGAGYRALFGVPLFVRGLQVRPAGCRLATETAAQMCRAKGAPVDETTVRTVQDILSFHYDLPELHLAAENNYLLDRLHLRDQPSRPGARAGHTHRPVNQEVRYRIVGHLLPDTLPSDALLTRNVRVENIGASIISSKAAPPVHLSYHWRTPAGGLVVYNGERTVLPVDLLPGRALTVPTLIRAPRAPGPYMLELTMVHEGQRWLEDDSFCVGVDVVPAYRLVVPGHWGPVKKLTEPYDYAKDHVRGQKRLHEEIQRRHRPGMRILEVGGCCNPMARGADADVYCVDIDVQTLQFGQALLAGPGERLYFVAADALDLPFADHSFDCAVMFSALHHLANPVEALVRLSRLLRPDGFLAIMCEPVGFYLKGEVFADFIRELEQGINEQMFTLEEYHHIFRRAGLYTSWVEVEGASFKAIVQPRPPATASVSPGLTWPARLWRGIGRRLRRAA